MPDRLTEIEARDHYPGELRAFFERVRAAVGCEHMHDDCWMVAQKVERLLAKRRSAEAATPTPHPHQPTPRRSDESRRRNHRR